MGERRGATPRQSKSKDDIAAAARAAGFTGNDSTLRTFVAFVVNLERDRIMTELERPCELITRIPTGRPDLCAIPKEHVGSCWSDGADKARVPVTAARVRAVVRP